MRSISKRLISRWRRFKEKQAAKPIIEDINGIVNEDFIEIFKTLDVYKSRSPIVEAVNFFRHSLNQFSFIQSQALQHSPHVAANIGLLDYVCGGGGLGIVCAKVLEPLQNTTYSGMDITGKRIELLNKKISNERVSFYKLVDGGLIDYIGVRDGTIGSIDRASLQSDASELPETNNPTNIEFSSSVFTHMTPKQITQRLAGFKQRGVELSINSFFIIDGARRGYLNSSLMANGRRKFRYFDGFSDYETFVEDEDNPLFTIGFSLEAIQRIYEESGWKIVSTINGDWASVYKSHRTPLYYQDWVIAVPK